MDLNITENASRTLAEKLLEIEAVRLNTRKPYVWTSGLKSPIYCDNRRTLAFPDLRTFIKQELVKLVETHFATAEGIAGVATAGIPQAALVAESTALPMMYVRAKAKEHGLENLVEGKLDDGQKVVVIEDLISTGKSSLAVVEALRQAGADVMGLLSIFTYGFPAAEEKFREAAVPVFSLTDYSTLIDVAREKEFVDEKQLLLLKSWRVDPQGWKPK